MKGGREGEKEMSRAEYIVEKGKMNSRNTKREEHSSFFSLCQERVRTMERGEKMTVTRDLPISCVITPLPVELTRAEET